jgi:hypothetical protein
VVTPFQELSPTENREPFATAQIALIYRTEGKSLHVNQTWTVIPVPEERFLCHQQYAVGCASNELETIFVSQAYGPAAFYAILIHEFMHEILYKVGDPNWISWLDERPLREEGEQMDGSFKEPNLVERVEWLEHGHTKMQQQIDEFLGWAREAQLLENRVKALEEKNE